MPKRHVAELLLWHSHPCQESGSWGQRGDKPQPRSREPQSRPERSPPAGPPCRAQRGSLLIKLDPASGGPTRPRKLRFGLPSASAGAALQDQARSRGWGCVCECMSRSNISQTSCSRFLQQPVGFPLFHPPTNHDCLQKSAHITSPVPTAAEMMGSPRSRGGGAPRGPGLPSRSPGAAAQRGGQGQNPVPAAVLGREGHALEIREDTASSGPRATPWLAGVPRPQRL